MEIDMPPANRTRSVLIPLFSAVLASLVALPLEAQPTAFRLEASKSAVFPGEAVMISVYLENPTSVEIGGGQFALDFDTASFSLTAIETPDQIPEAIPADLFLWNAPPPAGTGGLTGCTDWWDGDDRDAISVVVTYPPGGFTQPEGLVFRYQLTAQPTAEVGIETIAHQPPDATCLWGTGSVVVGSSGQLLLPNDQPSFQIGITDVLAPTDLFCLSAAGEIYLSWSNADNYDQVVVSRDGMPLVPLAGEAISFNDETAIPGVLHQYTILGESAGVASAGVQCEVSVSLAIPPPESLLCSDGGVGVGAVLTWSLPPVPWEAVDILRDGIVIETISGAPTMTTDLNAPRDVLLEYQVQGVLNGSSSPTTSCSLTLPLPVGVFLRGDASLDGLLNLADGILILGALFQMGSLGCEDAADTNDDGALDLADPIYLLNYLFAGGPEPAPPFPEAGLDQTEDPLGCASP